MARYLSFSDAHQRLESGCAIEQWLQAVRDGDDRLIKWLRIHVERPGEFGVTLLTVYDQGDDEYLDVGDFQPYFPDEPFGVMTIFKTPEAAIAFAVHNLGAKPEKFVNDGLIQKEYADFIRVNGKWLSGAARHGPQSRQN